MKKSLFILFVLMTSVVFSQEVPFESPKIAIKIPLGESINFDNHTIKFIEVLEDSRCPKNTTCVWEGRARVLVEISEIGKEPFKKALTFGKTLEGESKDKVLYSFKDSKVFGMMLTPYPNSKKEVKAPYVLLVYKETI